MHSLREMHEKEITSLRTELANEREHNTSLSKRDKDLLASSKAIESELRYELQTMCDKFERLQSEVVKLREFGRLENIKYVYFVSY